VHGLQRIYTAQAYKVQSSIHDVIKTGNFTVSVTLYAYRCCINCTPSARQIFFTVPITLHAIIQQPGINSIRVKDRERTIPVSGACLYKQMPMSDTAVKLYCMSYLKAESMELQKEEGREHAVRSVASLWLKVSHYNTQRSDDDGQMVGTMHLIKRSRSPDQRISFHQSLISYGIMHDKQKWYIQ